MTRLELVPITRDEAQAFVSRHHRTHAQRPVGWRFGVGAACDGAIVGVAMVSNPRARRLNDGWTVEVIRVCVLEGVPNACSKLYAACWRAARALGFRRLVTYTLPEEGGRRFGRPATSRSARRAAVRGRAASARASTSTPRSGSSAGKWPRSMTRDPITDPEVLADLRRRNESERDTTRTRPGAWTPPVIVEHWPCKGCGAMVGMTRDAIDLHAMFNRQLERRREAPLSKRALCPDCKRVDEELVAAQRRPHEQREMPIDGPTKAARELERRTNPNRRRNA